MGSLLMLPAPRLPFDWVVKLLAALVLLAVCCASVVVVGSCACASSDASNRAVGNTKLRTTVLRDSEGAKAAPGAGYGGNVCGRDRSSNGLSKIALWPSPSWVSGIVGIRVRSWIRGK